MVNSKHLSIINNEKLWRQKKQQPKVTVFTNYDKTQNSQNKSS